MNIVNILIVVGLFLSWAWYQIGYKSAIYDLNKPVIETNYESQKG